MAGLALACSDDGDGSGNPGGTAGNAATNGGDSGAAGTGGGAGSAGTAGSGGGPSGAALCPEGALFCDDFEDDTSGQVPASPWEPATTAGGVVTVDATRAFSGTNALLASAPGGAQYRRAYTALRAASGIFPGAAQEMYGRAMFWLDAAPTEVHWTIIQGEGRAASDTHNVLYRYGGQHGTGRFMANYETTAPVVSDCWHHSATVIPTQTWTCLEWRFATETNEMQLWMDGTELTDIAVAGTPQNGAEFGCPANADPSLGGQWLAPPAFESLYLGWEHYQPVATDTNLWIDGVAVSTERLGCPAAE